MGLLDTFLRETASLTPLSSAALLHLYTTFAFRIFSLDHPLQIRKQSRRISHHYRSSSHSHVSDTGSSKVLCVDNIGTQIRYSFTLHRVTLYRTQ